MIRLNFLTKCEICELALKVEARTANRIGEGLVMLQLDTQSIAAGVEFAGNKSFGFINAHGAFPSIRQFEFGIVEAVKFHGAPEHAAVERFVVRD